MGVIAKDDEYWLTLALAEAKQAALCQEVPVGAVMVAGDELLAAGHNQPIKSCDPTAHAEIVVLRQAAEQRQNYRLTQTTLYVTLEPCAMCLGAMLHARIQRLVFGAYDPRAGAVNSVFQLLNASEINHRIDWQGGVLEETCALLLKQFFRERR